MTFRIDESTIHVWQILPDEHPEYFQGFQVYRDMAYPDGYAGRWAKRSYEGARRLVGERYGRAWTSAQFHELGAYYRWQDRARAFDLALDDVAADKLMSEAARYRRAHLRRMAKLGELGEAEIDRHIRRAENLNRNPNDVIPITKPSETMDILERTTKVERLLLGETTDNPGGPPAVAVDLSGLTLDELETLARIRSKIDQK